MADAQPLTGPETRRPPERLLTAAEGEARSGGEETPGPEHLLLAATTLPDGTAARALAALCVDRGRLREAASAEAGLGWVRDQQ